MSWLIAFAPASVLLLFRKIGADQIPHQPTHYQTIERHGMPVGFDRTGTCAASNVFPIQKSHATTQQKGNQTDPFFTYPISHSVFLQK
jgi:hypothetical protein